MGAAVCEEAPAVGEPAGGAPHHPVMLDRVTDLLAVPGDRAGVLVDATVGAGGHAAALLARSGPAVHLVGFDRDPAALTLAEQRLAPFGARVHLVHAGYDDLDAWAAPVVARAGPLLGVLYDLGVSSMQLDVADRGFSFRADAPLDMRMDPTTGRSAADLVNTASVDELAAVLRAYGEERHARRIARALVAARPVTTTGGLARLVADAVPRAPRTGPHPATRTFQALRIAVNEELDRFRASLPQALERSAPAAGPGARGGRIAVLSYHSLEDRIAKQAFADAAAGCVCPPDLPVCACGRVPLVRHLTRGVERPAPQEVAANPRARAAKLRAVEKLEAARPEGDS